MDITLKWLKSKGACKERYRHLGKALGGIIRYGRNTKITVRQIFELNGGSDMVWALNMYALDKPINNCKIASIMSTAQLKHWKMLGGYKRFLEHCNVKDVKPYEEIYDLVAELSAGIAVVAHIKNIPYAEFLELGAYYDTLVEYLQAAGFKPGWYFDDEQATKLFLSEFDKAGL